MKSPEQAVIVVVCPFVQDKKRSESGEGRQLGSLSDIRAHVALPPGKKKFMSVIKFARVLRMRINSKRCALGILEGNILFNDSLNTFYLRKEGNVIFNDALNTFYLRLYGVRYMVKDHSDSER